MRRVVGMRAALLLAVSVCAAAQVSVTPALRVPPDQPPSPSAAPAPPSTTRVPVPAPPVPAPVAAPAPAPAPEAVPPVAATQPDSTATAPGGQPPLAATDIVPPLPPRSGPEPTPGPPHRLAGTRHLTPPATAADVPPLVPWALIPSLAVLLAVMVMLAVSALRWPSRLLATARLGMGVSPPVSPPAPLSLPPPVLEAAAVPVALGEAAHRLPEAVQRDLLDLAALLEEEDVGQRDPH
jgi:hypothetical protein